FRAEVPDRPPSFMAWTYSPAVDYLARLLVPAACFNLVLLAPLSGQAFLPRELGVSQGEHDPLAAVATVLKLAGLLQRLDACPPVARPVLDPPQVLPSKNRLRSKFDRLG